MSAVLEHPAGHSEQLVNTPHPLALADGELFTVLQVSAILKNHPQTIRRYIKERKIQVIDFGRRTYRISGAAIKRFINAREKPADE